MLYQDAEWYWIFLGKNNPCVEHNCTTNYYGSNVKVKL